MEEGRRKDRFVASIVGIAVMGANSMPHCHPLFGELLTPKLSISTTVSSSSMLNFNYRDSRDVQF